MEEPPKKKRGRPKGSSSPRHLTREHQARLQAARELKAKDRKARSKAITRAW